MPNHHSKNEPKKPDVFVLCGGLGTRISPILKTKPKILAKFGKHTFLDLLIHRLTENGFKRVILCTGFRGDQIETHVLHRRSSIYSTLGIDVLTSKEPERLGTGGALYHASKHIQSDPILALNGDSLCDVEFNDLLLFHQKQNNPALTMALLSTQNAKTDYGNVLLESFPDNKGGRILSFSEKNPEMFPPGQETWINAGVYLFSAKDFLNFSRKQATNNFSLEYDFFPHAAENKNAYGFFSPGELIDIGTPDRYQKALHDLGETPIDTADY